VFDALGLEALPLPTGVRSTAAAPSESATES
jgi:hypothetical protein